MQEIKNQIQIMIEHQKKGIENAEIVKKYKIIV